MNKPILGDSLISWFVQTTCHCFFVLVLAEYQAMANAVGETSRGCASYWPSFFFCPVRRDTLVYSPCSLELLISYGTIFFSHNKTTSDSLSAT
jgi:hypothetical protein